MVRQEPIPEEHRCRTSTNSPPPTPRSKQMATTPNARLKEICDAAVRHMHAFAREVNLTPAEWLSGIQFLTAVGQACTPVRQEFILLSDVLGSARVVNALHDRKARDSARRAACSGRSIARVRRSCRWVRSIVAHPSAEEIVVYGQVTGNDGKPIPVR